MRKFKGEILDEVEFDGGVRFGCMYEIEEVVFGRGNGLNEGTWIAYY